MWRECLLTISRGNLNLDLSDDTNYFSNKLIWKFAIFENTKFYNQTEGKRVGTRSKLTRKAGHHSELLYWTFNGQFNSKIDLALEMVSKITGLALTIPVVFSFKAFGKQVSLYSYRWTEFLVLVKKIGRWK